MIAVMNSPKILYDDSDLPLRVKFSHCVGNLLKMRVSLLQESRALGYPPMMPHHAKEFMEKALPTVSTITCTY